MVRKAVIAYTFTIALIFIIAIFARPGDGDKRSQFENFLINEYAKLSQHPDCEKVPDSPEMAAFHEFVTTVDPNKQRIPFDVRDDAYRYTKELHKAQQSKSTANQLQWQSTSAEMGGRTRAVMWDPSDPNGNKVWAGGVTGGLWYNNDITDDNTAWIPVNDFWENISISCIVADPNDPQTFYVGTGEAQTAVVIYRESSGVGIGIWKTTDGGQTWNIIPSTEDFKYITDIEVRDENGSSVVYAGVTSGLYYGTHQSLPTDGLYRSDNDGQTWEQVLPDIPGEGTPYAPADIEIASDGTIFVGTMRNINSEGGATILRSSTGLQNSWDVYDDYVAIIENNPNYYIPGRTIISCAPSNSDIAYAIIGAGYVGSSTGFTYSEGRYVLRTDDKGDSWVSKSIPNNDNWATLAWHALACDVDPADPDKLYIGGLDGYISHNGGNSWTKVSDWSLMYYGGGDDYLHADQHRYLYKENSSDVMLYVTDGGVFYSSNASNPNPVFEQKNNAYNTLQFYTCDIHPTAGINQFVGGLQDNGTLYYGGQPLDINDMIDGGDGAYCFFDDNEPHILISSVYYNRYTVYLNGNYHNYLDYYSGVFINPADLDYNENILYANAVTYGGSNQEKLLRISGLPSGNGGGYIDLNTGTNVYFSHVKYSKHSPTGTSTLFVGSQSGRLFKVENAQSTPQVTEIGSSSFPTANLSCVAIGGSEDTLLVTFSNYGVSSVWQTIDGGQSWGEKEGNLPDMPIRWALYHPDNANFAMLATETGIWTTDNLASDTPEWYPNVDGMANVRVDMLKIRETDNTVLAATHGRGLFWAEYQLPAALPSADFVANQTVIEEGESVNYTDLSTGNPESWEWSFEGGTPATSSEQNPEGIIYDAPGLYDVSLTVTNSAGTDMLVKEGYIEVGYLGTDDQDIHRSIKVSPNPSKGNFTLDLPSDFYASHIKILKTTGEKVYSQKVNRFAKKVNINWQNPVAGSYILVVEGKESAMTEKIIIK